MAKIRKFRAGDTVVDTSDSADKTAGLAASNAEKKSSGFLGLGRFLQGNIDEKGSEAYEKYGAGYGREVEAKNDRLKAATLREAALTASEARTDADRKAILESIVRRDGREEDRVQPVVKPFGSGPPDERLLGGKPMTINTYSSSTTPEKGDKGARDTSSFKKSTSTGSGSASTGSGATTPEKGDKGAKDTGRSQGSTGSGSGSGSGSTPAAGSGTANARTGQTYAQVDAKNQKDFTASPTSTDPAQRAAAAAARSAAAAKAAAAAKPAAVKPLSQAQQNAQAVIARATGNSSGSISNRPVPTPAEAARNIAEAAKKAGDTVSSFVDNFKIETIAERRSRLAKEAKAKETASFNRERGDRATGGVIKSYAKGGAVSASRRGDGIAQRGKTRGKMY